MNDQLPEYQFLFANMTQGAFFQNADGTFVDVNQAALKMLGSSRAELTGRTACHPEWRLVDADGTTLLPEQHPSMIALHSGTSVTDFVAGVFNPQQQDFIWLNINATPMFRPGENRPYRVFVTLDDISTQRQAAQALQESEARSRSFLENSFDVIFILDATGTFRFVCPSWEQHFGYPAGEVLGKPFSPVVHPDDVQPCFDYLRAVMTGNPGTSPPYRVKCADGTWKRFIANGSCFVDGRGELLFHGIGRDISGEQELMELLKAGEERYRAIVNSQTEFVDRYLPGGILTFVNDALCRYTGLSREALLGRTFYDFVQADDLKELVQLLTSRTPEQPSGITVNRCILPDGSRRWHQWTNTAIFDSQGVVVEYQSVGRDITEQKLNALALQKSEEKYRRLHENMIDGFAQTDMDGQIVEWNESFRRMLGYQAAELTALTYREITPEKWHAAESRLLVSEVMVAGYSRVYEKEYIRRDGTIIPVELRTYLLRDDRGQPVGMWAVVRDISDRKKLETTLRESEARYRRFISTANEGIGITDGNYTITYVNDRLAQMLGYAPEELLGTPVAELLAPEERRGFAEKMAARQQGVSSHRECWHLRKDGSRAWLLTSSTPILDDAGIFQGCFAMFTDLTGHREAEIALRQAHDELEQRVAERTAALATANEQIKRMSFQLVRAEELERARIASELHDQVGQSLLLAKMKLDMLASDLSSCPLADIATLLENSLNDIRTLTFGMRPPLLETAGIEAALEWLCASLFKDYTLQVDFSPSGQPLPFCSEKRYAIFQAVRELLLNVAKHAGVDRAVLSLQKSADHLVVQVIDSGSGFKTSSATATDSSFGLYNVRQRIEQLGGEVTIVSSVQGTSATLTIPLTQPLPGGPPCN